MRIAQVAPLHEAVPPKLYGGTERVVSYLTEELVALGHDVTLYASGDSITSARLVASCDSALRLDPQCLDTVVYHVLQLEALMGEAATYDIIHFHTDYMHYPWARRALAPTVTTLHGRQDLNDLIPLYEEYGDIPLVSISNAQRLPIAHANWVGTVYHGLPETLYRVSPGPGRYLAFLGRFSPEKGFERAVEIASRAGLPLKVAAKCDPIDRAYFDQVVRPLLNEPVVEYVGEIGEHEKADFLGGAIALLFPIDWPEPFGLVLIESMACGTPVIAWPSGSVPELVDHGVTGFIVRSIEGAVDAADEARRLDRARVRATFERRFSARRMTQDYLRLYRRLINAQPPIRPVFSRNG